MRPLPRHFVWLCLTLLLLVIAGCKTAKEDEEFSDRPWNSPQGWEHGLPPGMYDRR